MSHTIGQSASLARGTAENASSTVKVAAGYVLGERLGSGSFATVYKGIRLADYERAVINSNTIESHSSTVVFPSDSTAAIKVISRASKKLTKKVLENLDMEIAILRTYRHPNIVCLHEVQKTDRHFYLVLEYCGGGDLQRLIRTRKHGRLTERLCRRLVRDLSAGLGFLWGKELVHRDIKPQNLLLTGPLPPDEEADNPSREDAKNAILGSTGERFMLKIADFGFARHLAGVDLAETMCGSPLYMAPEILSGEKYSAKADLWSVGSVLFEMVAGVTPFHGENHLDLLRNIKTKAVRLPANVRISKEFVTLLKLLLDRKPHTRADFNSFFEASEALVALGCNGTPAVPPSTAGSMQSMIAPTGSISGEKIVEKDVCVQMNLCAISENDTGDSFHRGNASLSTVETSETDTSSQGRQPKQNVNRSDTMNALVQIRPDHMNKPGVVTPPFHPVTATKPPPSLSYALSGTGRQHCTRPSIFAPLQGSPNLYPSVVPSAIPSPPLFMLSGAPNDALSHPHSSQPIPPHNQSDCTSGRTVIHENQMFGTRASVSDRQNSSSKVSSHESLDSEFVMVEHSSCRNKTGGGRDSPSNPMGGLIHSISSCSPNNSSGRVTILDARNNMGILGTSPGTGRALFGKMMMGSPAQSTFAHGLSPRAAFSAGGCLAHIEVLVRMLSASEDIGRRAITVAHLGDMRAYLGMGLLVTLKEESQLSSMSTGTSMEGVDEERSTDVSNSLRLQLEKSVPEEETNPEDEDEDEEEMPFSMTSSSDGGTDAKLLSDPTTHNVVSVVRNSQNEKARGNLMTLRTIHLHFREALMCYFKALTMMKVSISATQKVIKEVDEVCQQSLSGNMSEPDKNPYTPLKDRCSSSLEWLGGQFSAVLERADAASDQISKLHKANPSQLDEREEVQVCVEELIYNHSLKCGREGAVKQILGQYDAARLCFRSAGLLAETLLMESKVGDEDRIVLEGYVNSFADQIITLDGLIRVEMKKSHGIVSVIHHNQNNSREGQLG